MGDEKTEAKLEIAFTKGALDGITSLSHRLDLSKKDVIIFALRMLEDACEVGIVTPQTIGGKDARKDIIPYEQSWVAAFRLYYCIANVAPLSEIHKIVVYSRKRNKGINWKKDFENFGGRRWPT